MAPVILEACEYVGGYVPTTAPAHVRLRFGDDDVQVEVLGETWTDWLVLPWSELTGLTIEGVDQAQLRPSIAAVAAFGVLGLAARKQEFSSFIVLGTEKGELAFSVRGFGPAALRAQLGAQLAKVNQAESSARSDDPTDLLAKLADLHRAGVLTEDEFESKKAELLGRL